MHLVKKIAAWVFLLAVLWGLLVSGSVIPDSWWHGMPAWLKVGLAGLGVLSGLAVMADSVMRLFSPAQSDNEKA